MRDAGSIVGNAKPKKVLSAFSLVMINIIAIDSLRNVPAAAEYGFSLVFYYAIAALFFFIPTALISAELATAWPRTGGVYVWVREAFGVRWGFLAIWLQWVENVIWYPTMMAFIAATILYMVDPGLVEHRAYLLSIMLGLFWLATLLNLFGMQISSWVSTLTALLGTLLPMLLIVGLGLFWLFGGHPSQIEVSWGSLIPDLSHPSSYAFISAVLLSLVGMELSPVHAQEVRMPQRDYPRAMLISVFIIMGTLVLASLAIALVVPKEDINLVAGLIQAFGAFFAAYHLSWLLPFIAVLIVIGGFGGVSAWIIGPNKGLLVAARDGEVPAIFQHTNRFSVPVTLLFVQALIFTGLCTVFLYLPSVNSSYWILTVLTTQLYMGMYLLMFLAAIRLRYKHPEVVRAYKVPGGNFGMWVCAGMGAFASVFTFFIGFLPPGDFDFGGIQIYEGFLVAGFAILNLPPLLFAFFHAKKQKVSDR